MYTKIYSVNKTRVFRILLFHESQFFFTINYNFYFFYYVLSWLIQPLKRENTRIPITVIYCSFDVSTKHHSYSISIFTGETKSSAILSFSLKLLLIQLSNHIRMIHPNPNSLNCFTN